LATCTPFFGSTGDDSRKEESMTKMKRIGSGTEAQGLSKYEQDKAEFERLTGASPLANKPQDRIIIDEAAEVPELAFATETRQPFIENIEDATNPVVDPQTVLEVMEQEAQDESLATPEEDPLAQLDLSTSPFQALLGGAGTGKSTAIRERAKQRTDLLITSTTGIAAINLGGTTINAALGYFDTNDLENNYTKGWLSARLRRLRSSGIRQIVVDEVSMMDGKQLTILTRACDEVNKVSNYEEYIERIVQDGEPDPDWMGVLLVGDFCQLPPVKAPFAFESVEWGRYDANAVRLSRIYRQDNPDFIRALRATRRGDGRAALEYFESRMHDRVDPAFPGPTILAKNDEVDRVNRLRMDEIRGEAVPFKADRWGKERGEWKQIPDELVLKVGAKVMILANRREIDEETGRATKNYKYINGDIGTVVDVVKFKAPPKTEGEDPEQRAEWERLERESEAQACSVRLERTGRTVDVEPVIRQNLKPLESGRLNELLASGQRHLVKYVLDQDTGKMSAEWEVVGEVTYMPLRVAYATTVHKCQGLSLSDVQVNISNPFMANPGSLYVALSRARTPEGLRLVGNPAQFISRCVADKKVARFL
jgi:hypothetical protein